jgi:hypothetical protein
MKLALALVLIGGLTAVVQASDNSIEVTLQPITITASKTGREGPPGDHEAPPKALDGYWRNKFEGGSDKPLGTPKDTAAIKALVPATISPTIRWVSPSIVVVSADCRPPPPYVLAAGCLYVFEKHGSKWNLTHYYRWPFPQFF